MEEQFKQHPKYKAIKIGNQGTILKDGDVFRTKKKNSVIWLEGKTITYTDMINSISFDEPIQPIKKKEKPVKSTVQNEIKKEHWLKGYKHTTQAKQNMSDSKKGSKNHKFKGYYVVNGIEYDNLNVIAELLNLNPKTIYKRCKANKNGYSFKPFLQ